MHSIRRVLRTHHHIRVTSRYTTVHDAGPSRSCYTILPGSTSKSSPCTALVRGYSSQVQNAESSPGDKSSIFSPESSPWDHIFEDVGMRQPLTPMSGSPRTGLHNSSLGPRRQTMSNQELMAFDDMFNIVFTAANERRLAEDGTAGAFDIDTRTPLTEFLKNLSKRPPVRTRSEDTELDRLKEQLALCQSDYAVLEWAEREVFGASIRAEEAARAAVAEGKPPPLHLQPPLYPQLLAMLMNTAREGYDDPHLALALFEHARNLSPLSYIFGCTTPAYNELLETRWHSFRDLRGVHAALEEMRANGISPDVHTRALVDDVRHEVGARTVWLEESETGSGEVWTMLREIERLVARRAPRQASSDNYGALQERPRPHDVWKNPELTSDESAGYQFGEWPEPERRRQRRRRASYS